MTPPIPPGERPALRALVPVPLLTAVLAALAVGGSVAMAPESARPALAWGAGTAALLLTAAVATAVHAAQTTRLVRRRLDAVSQDAGRLLQDRARLAEELRQERARLTDDFVRERARLAEDFERERTRLTEESEQERRRLTTDRARLAEEKAELADRVRKAESERAAAVSATANAAGRMQALATGTLADLREMEERHTDEDVLTDLLHLDHRTAQANRLADSVAVLAGARSGRRWARPIPMESILRGAMGRIGGYQRVRLHSSSEAAVAGHAAEAVMHALAELLDNAANFSPPTAEVHVYVEEVPTGVIVSVEDAGLVMSDIQLRRAERAVSGEGAGLGGLSGTRLGLAVVGRLSVKHGLKVSFRPSARGGTGVLMLIPQDLLAGAFAPAPAPAPRSEPVPPPPLAAASYATARAPQDVDPEPVPTHESAAGPDSGLSAEDPSPSGSPSSSPSGPPAASPATTSDLPGALPRRRRGQTLAAAQARTRDRVPARPDPEARPAADPRARAARFSSFRSAVRGSVPDQALVQGTTTEVPLEVPVAVPTEVPVEGAGAVRRAEARAELVRAPKATSLDDAPDAPQAPQAPHSPAPSQPQSQTQTQSKSQSQSQSQSHPYPEGDPTS
ncbi:sensor histidine kinase [Streptomyces spongiae]|uniref:histidine kinase n=1 Tax=Streptomyces spongiae TaxID=565072 RepID=A0A5N8XQ04_9ACTN|nr:ATP-binding protein [Streptomyces spongiae]MPY61471.1 sensor histidine kinase [Streptomyces spongiae]